MIVVSDSTVLIGLVKIGQLDDIKSLIEELRRKKFRISDGIIAQALKHAGERF